MKRIGVVIGSLIIILTSISVLAAGWVATLIVSNSSTTVYSMLASNVSANITYLVDQHFINSSGNDTQMQSAGAAMPYMLASDRITLAHSIGANTNNAYQLLTGQTERQYPFAIIPGHNGFVRIPDSANLEWSNNGSANFSGYVDTSLTYSIDDFSTFTQVDFSDNISIPNGLRINSSNLSSVQNYYVYKDYVSNNFTSINIQFEIFTHADALTQLGFNGIAFTNTLSSISGLAATDLWIATQARTATTMRVWLGRGNFIASANSNDMPSDNTLYMVILHNAGSDSAQLNIYSDPLYSTNVTSLSISGLGTASWRYGFGGINFNDGTPNRLWTGYVQNRSRDILDKGVVNVSVYNGGVTTQAFDNNTQLFSVVNKTLSSGNHTISSILNSTSLGLSFDGGVSSTNFSATIPNTSANWSLLRNVAYTDNISMSVGGTQQVYYSNPTTIILLSTLPDRSADATNNDGTIVWGDNPTGISVTMSSFEPSTVSVTVPSIPDGIQDIAPLTTSNGTKVNPQTATPPVTPISPLMQFLAGTYAYNLPEFVLWVLMGWLASVVAFAITLSLFKHIGAAGIIGSAIWGLFVVVLHLPNIWIALSVLGMAVTLVQENR